MRPNSGWRVGDNDQNNLLFPVRDSNFDLFVSRDMENCGDFDSETPVMTVALLANLRASHAAMRTASSFTFRVRV